MGLHFCLHGFKILKIAFLCFVLCFLILLIEGHSLTMAASTQTDTVVPLKPPTTSHESVEDTTQATTSYNFINDINLEDLDLTNAREEIDFSGVEANLNAFREDDIVAMALDQNVNLTNYSKKIENDLRACEIASIADYIAHSEDLVSLHDSIETTDSLLESMQNMLSGFQDHLKQISGEIRHLQDKSLSMNIELQNQKQTETILNKYVDELEITTEFIEHITSSPVGKDYIQHLVALNRKIQFHQSLDPQWTAYQDIATKLITLQNRATLRIRAFLIAQFNQLAVPKTNISLKQQHLLLFKYFQTFLDERNENMKQTALKRQPSISHSSYSGSSMMSGRSGTFDDDIANQLRTFYTDLMSKVYMGHFKSYVQSLTKYRETAVPSKNDLLACDVAKTGGLFSSKKSIEYLNRVFSLGKRINVCKGKANEPAIVVQMIDPQNDRFQYEEIFKSFLRLLTDTAINEYRFLLQFFHSNNMFNKIFDRVLQQFIEEFDAFRQSCYDSIGLLLMIRLVEMIHKELEKKQVSCLESFFDEIVQAFWPRFNIIFDDNVKSIETCEPNKADMKLLNANRSLNTPHFTTIRVASYITAILTLNIAQKQQILSIRIESLRVAFEKLLLRFGDKIENQMSRYVYLINNYSIIIATMNKEINITSTKTYMVFNDSLNQLSQRYIDEELKLHLSRWIGFTLTTEQKLAKDANTKIDMTSILSIAKEFKLNWKQKLKIAMNNIKSNFALNVDANITEQIGQDELFRNQREIKKKFLQQLLIYHARFETVVHQIFANQGRNPQIMSLLVPVNTMKYDVKAFWDV
eukprot:735196_1